ncbi:MAG: BlaI/MecI/CopY family transcriptional regulator [Bacteroidota bacterium]
MTAAKHPKPTDSELEILQILWEHGPSSVRFVNDQLNLRKPANQKEIGYTTTLKLMQIMTGKGLTHRNTDSRTHIYEALAEETETQRRLLEQFVDATFRGSAMKMVMQALGNNRTSQKELDEIKALIRQIEEGDENQSA